MRILKIFHLPPSLFCLSLPIVLQLVFSSCWQPSKLFRAWYWKSLSKFRNLMTVLSDSALAVVIIIKTNLYSEQSPCAPNPSAQVHPSLPLCDPGPPCPKALSLERTICFASLTLTLPQWVPPSTPSHHPSHLQRSLSLSRLVQVPLPL